MSERLRPMLAARGEPFDSPEYLFEVKWNGIRALAARHAAGWDLWGRESADYRPRYPEMQALAALPPGTVLDGELVLLPDGVPDLEAILARHQLTSPVKTKQASRERPVTYVVFDLLAHQGRSLVGQPLQARRALLSELMMRWQEPRVQFSEGVVGPGRLFFEEAVRQGQEGIMAKHLGSRYLPGRRSSGWLKIKPKRRMPCVVFGWELGACGLRALFVAAPWAGRLRYVANVRTGFTERDRRHLAAVLARLSRNQQVVHCPHPGLWIEPEAVCEVTYLEWTKAGRLRGASFHRLLTDQELHPIR